MIMKGIVYKQLQKWVIKVSFKRKVFAEFLSNKKKIVLCKKEFYVSRSLTHILVQIFDEWRKIVTEKKLKKY